MVLLSTKNPTVSNTVVKSTANSISTKPIALATSEALMTETSPQRWVAGPVSSPWAMAETNPMTVRMVPTCCGP